MRENLCNLLGHELTLPLKLYNGTSLRSVNMECQVCAACYLYLPRNDSPFVGWDYEGGEIVVPDSVRATLVAAAQENAPSS